MKILDNAVGNIHRSKILRKNIHLLIPYVIFCLNIGHMKVLVLKISISLCDVSSEKENHLKRV